MLEVYYSAGPGIERYARSLGGRDPAEKERRCFFCRGRICAGGAMAGCGGNFVRRFGRATKINAKLGKVFLAARWRKGKIRTGGSASRRNLSSCTAHRLRGCAKD